VIENRISIGDAKGRLLDGRGVYRRYPNGCVYRYFGGTFALVNTEPHIETQTLDSSGDRFHWVAASRSKLLGLASSGAEDVRLSQIVICGQAQMVQPALLSMFGDMSELPLCDIEPAMMVEFHFDRNINGLTIRYLNSSWNTGEYKPFTKPDEISMDCGDWFIFQ